MSFVHLHVHSHYSMMRGVDSLESLAQTARERGMDRFALTDTNALYGFVFYRQICEEAGLVPIAGAEIVPPGAPAAAPGGAGRAVLLARGREGYGSLCRVITARHLEPDFSLERSLRRRADGLFLLSEDGALLAALRDTLPVHAELVPGRGDRPLRAWARERGIPAVATNDVHFAAPEGHRLHRVLRAIDRNTTIERVPEDDLAEAGRWLAPPDEMERRLAHAPEALETAARLGEACACDWPIGATVFPAYPLERGDAFAVLRARCEAGIVHRYGKDPAPEVRARLDRELGVIREKGFAGYFLIVEAITSRTPRLCGRGSGAASIVAYLLGITNVDPVRHNLFFERFLSPERRDPPDIDVDFAWDERDRIQLDVLAENGAPVRAAMVANHVGFRAKGAIHEIAKVYGLPEAEIRNVTKRLQGYWGLEDPVGRLDGRPRFRDVDFEPPWPEILAQAVALEGHPRHLSVHSGGVVLVPGDLADHVPVEIAPKGVPIVQWEKDQVEDYGLVKMDLLGNRSLAVIRDALAAVARNTGRTIDERTWNPIDDPETKALMARGETVGVFYVESPAMRQLQRKACRGDFDHLVIHSSMIRPAANRFIREYVRRLKGGAYDPLHPALSHTLDETYGIMVYQEDVTKVSMELAGFTVAQGEALRKVLTKKRPTKPLSAYRDEFFAGARGRGVAEPVIDAVWEMILSFAGYSFCKPHSASYAMVSFRSGWLRAHFPAEFIAAVISNQGGYYAAFAYVSEAKRMGLRVLPPDANASDRATTGRAREVRVGLMQVKGLHAGATDALLAERARGGPFASFADLRRRVPLHVSDMELLVKAGACDSLDGGRARAELLWELYLDDAGEAEARTRRAPSQPREARRGPAPGGLLAPASPPRRGAGSLELFPRPAATVPRAPAYDRQTMLRHEVETLGFLLSAHPLEPYERAMWDRGVIRARDLDRHAGRRVTVLGWHVTSKLVHTKDDEPMEFVSFEDTTALYDATFFPRAYDRFCHLLTSTRPFLLTGRVEEDDGVCTLNVERVERL
ncbi:MAG: DNA polymerase III subunit alpha [Hyphomicrobiales bacterium]